MCAQQDYCIKIFKQKISIMALGKLKPGIGIGVNSRRGGGILANGVGQSFNGVDQYAYVTDNGDLDIKAAIDAGATDFCFGGKIKTGNDITRVQGTFGKIVFGAGASGSYGFLIASGTIYCRVQTSEDPLSIADNITFSVNTEYYLLARVDITNSKVYFYINGVLQNTGGWSFTGTFSNLPNQHKYHVAAYSQSQNKFEGIVRDVRIYHKDVSGADNQTDWMAGKSLGNEVAWWNLPTLTGYNNTNYDLTGVNL
jgi:hypothetical protein